MRRRWWEVVPKARRYAEGQIRKLFNIPLNSLENRELVYFLLKHRDFTCAWYSRSMPVEERLHKALAEAMHRSDEALAFVMLEIERRFLRSAEREVPALRLIHAIRGGKP